MKILKSIARRILKKEIQSFMYEIASLKEALNGNHKNFISENMAKCILDMLPDPNRAGNNRVSDFDLNIRNRMMTEDVNGIKQVLSFKFVPSGLSKTFRTDKFVKIHISGYDIEVTIPLIFENSREKSMGVDVEIGTFAWNLSGIRVLTEDAWIMYAQALLGMKSASELFK